MSSRRRGYPGKKKSRKGKSKRIKKYTNSRGGIRL